MSVDLAAVIPGYDGPDRPEPYVPPDLRQWTLDRCTNVLMGVRVRPASEYPCEGPYPCGDTDFWPGFAEAVSAHPVRGVDLMGLAGWENEELCHPHSGGFLLGADGFVDVATQVLPDRLGDWQAATGPFLIYNESTHGAGIEGDGFAVGFVAIPTPPWFAAALYGDLVECGNPL